MEIYRFQVHQFAVTDLCIGFFLKPRFPAPVKSSVQQAHEEIARLLRPGDIVIDATAGNGHDTHFLAECVCPGGRVFSLDIQPMALEKTTARLPAELTASVTLLLADHACLQQIVPEEIQGQVACVMFNLGYLPGGDKNLVTAETSTLLALGQSLDLLKAGGILSVIAYVGHPGGLKEAEQVQEFLHARQPALEILVTPSREQKSLAPRFFLARKRADFIEG